MQGKTIVITGATSGIGEITAMHLADQGARIVFIARDAKRAEATRARLSGQGHVYHFADLSLLAEVKRVGAAIAAAEPRIDVLMNNAGALFASRKLTADGLERTFAVNHMSYFVMTALLRSRLALGGRIVNTASAAHWGAKLDFDDLQSARGFSAYGVYQRSKLCNILFTRALARRLEHGQTATCFHPGFVATRFGDSAGGATAAAFKVAKLTAISPEDGAKTMIYLAKTPDVANGAYYNRCKIEAPSREAQDDAAAAKLWTMSATIATL
jgi:NAD(P)-dependent dehydrogenase (short-subunit alcohol dehydrogenase family)